MALLSGLNDAVSGIGRGISRFGSKAERWWKGDPPVDPSKVGDYSYLRDYARGGLDRGGRTAPTIGAPDISGAGDSWRRQQLALAQQLAGVASGQRQGAGELAAQRQGASAVAQQMAMANMQRGAGGAMAARTAARNMGDIGLNVVGQSQQAALADQAAARGQLAGVLGTGRGQDIDLATAQGQMQLNAQIAQADATLRQMGLDDAQIANYLALLYGMSKDELQARMNQRDPGMRGFVYGIGGNILTAYATGGLGKGPPGPGTNGSGGATGSGSYPYGPSGGAY